MALDINNSLKQKNRLFQIIFAAAVFLLKRRLVFRIIQRRKCGATRILFAKAINFIFDVYLFDWHRNSRTVFACLV
jgi:hypothetical protein